MRNGPRVNGSAPYPGRGSYGNGLAYGSAPASEQELRLASDIADLINRRSQPRAPQPRSAQRSGGLAAALGNLHRDALAEAGHGAAEERVFPPPPPPQSEPMAAPAHRAYAMAGMSRVTDADRAMPPPRTGTWIKQARRRRTLGAVRAAAAWMTSLAIVGLVVATAAVLLGVPRDLNSLSQLATFLLNH